MAIYDHKYGELSYYRVFRAWGGQEHQEYVRIKDDPKAAYAEAKAIDEKLAAQQLAHARDRAQQVDYHIHADGHIRGLRRVTVTRKGRQPTEVFELRINVPWREQVKRTTISMAVHGPEKAFDLAIQRICDFYDLAPEGETAQALSASRKIYLPELEEGIGQAISKARNELSQLTEGLLKGFRRFTA